MSKFRLPRKIKKKLSSVFFLYPEVDGGSLMALPKENQKDYDAYKNGILQTPFKKSKKQRKIDSQIWNSKFTNPVEISDKELLYAINEIFAEEYRTESYSILKRAKQHPVAIKDYYIFVNA